MKKQIIIILSSLFFVAGLFLSSVQAANLDDLEICPKPFLDPFVIEPFERSPEAINPMTPKGDDRVLEEGYTCKVATVETRPDSDVGYKNGGQGDVYVQWTLVKKEEDRGIWAAHTGRWGLIYVGDVENVETGFYTFSEAVDVCKNKEVVINGERIQMTLPKIGFGEGDSDIENPLNFELLKYLNYTSVVPNRFRRWFWSGSSIDNEIDAWVFQPTSSDFSNYYRRSPYVSVRCVGR